MPETFFVNIVILESGIFVSAGAVANPPPVPTKPPATHCAIPELFSMMFGIAVSVKGPFRVQSVVIWDCFHRKTCPWQ
jgi:hypothetical protein